MRARDHVGLSSAFNNINHIIALQLRTKVAKDYRLNDLGIVELEAIRRMYGELLIRTESIDRGVEYVRNKTCLVNGPMIESLEKRVILLLNVGIEDAHKAIITTTEQVHTVEMVLKSSNVVVVLGTLPSHVSAAFVPEFLFVSKERVLPEVVR